jgi:RNA polymerase sigma-70 factor (ECF subfamily)
MVENSMRERFEQALSPEVYQAAWRFALRLSTRREDAEDLLQESLIKAYSRFSQLRDASRFKSWFFSIVRSTHLDRLRREHARPPETAELPQLAARETEPLSRDIAEALARLPKPQQELLCLFYIDGLNLNETGQALGIRPRAVRQRLYRARQSLRQQLDSIPAAERTPAGGRQLP